MNKTEFLLRLKLQKGLSYLKILQVMQQMPQMRTWTMNG